MTTSVADNAQGQADHAIGGFSAQFAASDVEEAFRRAADAEQRRLTTTGAAVMAAAMAVLTLLNLVGHGADAIPWLCIGACLGVTVAIAALAIIAHRGGTTGRLFDAALSFCAALLLIADGAHIAFARLPAGAFALLLISQMLFAALVLSARPRLASGFILSAAATYGLHAALVADAPLAVAQGGIFVALAAYIGIELTRRPAWVRRALYAANARWQQANDEKTRVLNDLEGERDALQLAAARNVELVEEMDFIRRDAENQSRFLRIIFDNITQGVAVFTRERRLSTWNHRLETLLGLPEGFAREGLALADLLRFHAGQIAAAGGEAQTPAVLDAALAAIGPGQPPPRLESRLADGRTLEIRAAAIPNGGLLITYGDITDSKRAEDAARHMAEHDALTGLKNRRGFMEILNGAADGAQIEQPFGLALFDLDGFKAVNDRFGHPVGDALLRRVGRIITSEVRGGDCVARLGGDEFAVIFHAIHDPQDAEVPARRILERLSQPLIVEGQAAHIGVSIGLGFYPLDADSVEALLDRVDQALYSAKKKGKGCVVRVAA